jgi:hypothetical protein
MKHLNYCSKKWRERMASLLSDLSLQFIPSPSAQTISLKILHCYIPFLSFLSWYFITFFMFFRGEKKFLSYTPREELKMNPRKEQRERKRQNYDSHYFKFDWNSSDIPSHLLAAWMWHFKKKGGKPTKVEGVFGKEIGLTWLKYEMIPFSSIIIDRKL